MIPDIPTNLMIVSSVAIVCCAAILALIVYLTYEENKAMVKIVKLGVSKPTNDPLSGAYSPLPVTPGIAPLPPPVPDHLLEAARSVVYIGKANLAQINILLSYSNEPYRSSTRIDGKLMGIARSIIDIDAAAYPKSALDDLTAKVIEAGKYDSQ